MKVIDKETILFAFLGEMANKSPFPKEFNEIFTSKNLNASYIPLNIRDDDILFTVNGLKKSQIRGVNIAKEYQTEILTLLDSYSDEVEKCGFVESLKIENGKLHGYISIGKAINSLTSGKIAIFGSDKIAESILFSAEDISNFTIVEEYIEDSSKLLETYSNLDVRFSDETHHFDNSEYSLIIKLNKKEIFLKNETEILDISKDSPKKVRDIQHSIDIREWL